MTPDQIELIARLRERVWSRKNEHAKHMREDGLQRWGEYDEDDWFLELLDSLDK